MLLAVLQAREGPHLLLPPAQLLIEHIYNENAFQATLNYLQKQPRLAFGLILVYGQLSFHLVLAGWSAPLPLLFKLQVQELPQLLFKITWNLIFNPGLAEQLPAAQLQPFVLGPPGPLIPPIIIYQVQRLLV